MAARKKTKKRVTKSNKSASRKPAGTKKPNKANNKAKRPANRNKTRRKSASRATAVRNTRAIALSGGSAERSSLGRDVTVETAPVIPKGLGARSGGQSGALQGLSDLEGAASESVDELLEEGNAFEAEIVKGVEDAGNDGERPVPIHRVTEDDVPEENVPDEYFRKE